MIEEIRVEEEEGDINEKSVKGGTTVLPVFLSLFLADVLEGELLDSLAVWADLEEFEEEFEEDMRWRGNCGRFGEGDVDVVFFELFIGAAYWGDEEGDIWCIEPREGEDLILIVFEGEAFREFLIGIEDFSL